MPRSLLLRENTEPARAATDTPPAKPLKANDLNGAQWTRNSVSVWSDIRKTAEELKLGHPAMFPEMLVRRLLACFTRADEKAVLDPFMGSGSTLVAAYHMGKRGIGFEISEDFIRLAHSRFKQGMLDFRGVPSDHTMPEIYREDARNLATVLTGSVDICIPARLTGTSSNRNPPPTAKPQGTMATSKQTLVKSGTTNSF